MADPRQELADIIAPAAPEMIPAGGGHVAGWGVVALLVLAGVALGFWAWRRRRPARALRTLERAVAARQGGVSELAARLDAWARQVFRLSRVDAAACPPGIDPGAWAAWARTLDQLRFAPSPPDGFAALADLCARAHGWRGRV